MKLRITACILIGFLCLIYQILADTWQNALVNETATAIPIATNCHDIREKNDQCAYAQFYCNNGSLFNYISFAFCHLHGYTAAILLVFTPMIAYLFLFLASAASDFFCPNLAHVSKTLGLSETVSGVTLVAFGNGVSDLQGVLTSFQAQASTLALGELVGAGLFVSSVVVGTVAVVNPFSIPRRPFLRDVLFFLGAVILLVVLASDGQLSLYDGIVLDLYYMLYVTVVVVGNKIYRRMHMSDKLVEMSHSPLPAMIERKNPVSPTPVAPALCRTDSSDTLCPLLPSQIAEESMSLSTHKVNNTPSSIDLPAKQQSLLSLLLPTLPLTRSRKKEWNELQWHRKIVLILQAPIVFVLQLTVAVISDSFESSGTKPVSRADEAEAAIDKALCHYKSKMLLITTQLALCPLFIYLNWFDGDYSVTLPLVNASIVLLWIVALASGAAAAVFYYGITRFLWNRFAERYLNDPAIRLYYSGRVWGRSFPVSTDCGYYAGHTREQSQIRTCAASERQFIAFASFLQSIGASRTCVLVLEQFKVSLVLALLGILTGITWIQLISQEMVGILQAVIAVTGIDEQIMGMTVLAFGNSLPDLLTNTGLARLGFPATAVGSSFGAPMLNMVLGIGFTVTYLTIRDAGKVGVPWSNLTYPVSFNSHMLVACYGLILTLTVSLVLVPLNRFYLSKTLGRSLIVLYCAVLIGIVIFGLAE